MLVLLQGAIGDQTQLHALRVRRSRRDVHSIDLAGHGASAVHARALAVERFADDLLAWALGE